MRESKKKGRGKENYPFFALDKINHVHNSASKTAQGSLARKKMCLCLSLIFHNYKIVFKSESFLLFNSPATTNPVWQFSLQDHMSLWPPKPMASKFQLKSTWALSHTHFIFLNIPHFLSLSTNLSLLHIHPFFLFLYIFSIKVCYLYYLNF